MARSQFIRILKKIRPYTIKKGLLYLKHYGVKDFMSRLAERIEPEEVPYGPWYEAHKASEEVLEKQRRVQWKNPVTISIAVPAYHTPEEFLCQLLDSLQAQTYPYWELCIANASPEDEKMGAVLRRYCREDQRIRVQELQENAGISENTNAALFMATGEYVGLLDHDDLLAPDCLYEVAVRIRDEGADMIYTDEDKVTADLSEHYQPHLKPDFSPDLLRSNNYICHFFTVSRELLETVGGFRKEFDGAQDHDFIFRCSEKAQHIAHVPRILYHWRTHKASTADNPASKLYAYDAGKRAVEGNLERMGLKGTVSHTKDYGFYNVEYEVQGEPLVSILIPNKDQRETLETCIRSIREKTTYKNYEILIIENNSEEEDIFRYYKVLSADPRIHLLRWKKGFNYSAINNFGARKAKGEYLLFLNNDIEILTPDWIQQLLANCQRPEVGICGCKLYYPDRTIQHAGVIVGLGGIAGHAFLNMPGSRTGYLHKASIQLNTSAVTAACMMMKKELFDELGGFEEKLTVAFNDVDLCLRTVQAGYRIVYNPHAEMIHYESKSRGAEDSPEKVRRFQGEIEFMRSRWIDFLKKGDPMYNPNLTLSKWNYSLRAKQ
ncbi:MAG: glycosyltransferase family 2 protein [Lachnospiraceae bacterium]|nr:glycosyltransferase family 2 protein [Lachnospiraceae bacterium]